MEIKSIKNVVFSGGGLKGWCYIGVLRVLSEYGVRKKIKNVAGSSVGSFFALLFVLDIKYETILDKIIHTNQDKFLDVDLNNILNNQSIIQGAQVKNFIVELMEEKVDQDITFSELYEHTKINYITNSLCITNQKLQYFNKDETPNIKVIDAIMASCSIPLILPAICINNQYYYDGSLCDPCPTQLFEESGTVGFNLTAYNEVNDSGFKVVDLINTLSKIIFDKSIKSDTIMYHFKDICDNTDFLNFNQSKDRIFNLYKHSYNKIKESMYTDYLALPPPQKPVQR